MKKQKLNLFKASTFDIGPFHLYRTSDGSLDIGLKAFKDEPFGWEYGWEDKNRLESKPIIQFRVGKMNILYFEKWDKGFEVWFLGFWWIK